LAPSIAGQVAAPVVLSASEQSVGDVVGSAITRATIPEAEEVVVSQAAYEAALNMVFPSHYAHDVALLVDAIGNRAAQRAMQNRAFVQALQNGNRTLAGTLFHSAAAAEAQAVPVAALLSMPN
jgi:hypothetical protein